MLRRFLDQSQAWLRAFSRPRIRYICFRVWLVPLTGCMYLESWKSNGSHTCNMSWRKIWFPFLMVHQHQVLPATKWRNEKAVNNKITSFSGGGARGLWNERSEEGRYWSLFDLRNENKIKHFYTFDYHLGLMVGRRVFNISLPYF